MDLTIKYVNVTMIFLTMSNCAQFWMFKRHSDLREGSSHSIKHFETDIFPPAVSHTYISMRDMTSNTRNMCEPRERLRAPGPFDSITNMGSCWKLIVKIVTISPSLCAKKQSNIKPSGCRRLRGGRLSVQIVWLFLATKVSTSRQHLAE